MACKNRTHLLRGNWIRAFRTTPSHFTRTSPNDPPLLKSKEGKLLTRSKSDGISSLKNLQAFLLLVPCPDNYREESKGGGEIL